LESVDLLRVHQGPALSAANAVTTSAISALITGLGKIDDGKGGALSHECLKLITDLSFLRENEYDLTFRMSFPSNANIPPGSARLDSVLLEFEEIP